MVWIRSQGKRELAFVSNIWSYDTIIYASNGGRGSGIKIGAYSTGAEALQVMDMIQEHNHRVQKMWFMGKEDEFFVDPIFQMPEAGFSAQGGEE